MTRDGPEGAGTARGGGDARGRNRAPPSREVQVSKKISWLLRHGAEKEGLQLGQGGYVDVADVLSNRNIRSLKVTFDEIRSIVSTNDKQRFSLILKADTPDPVPISDDAATATATPSEPSDSPSDYLIRANQGHSLTVSNEGLLTPITLFNVPSTAVHGTTHGAWHLILDSGGLKRMTRTHIHFAAGLPAGFKSVTEALLPTPAAGDNESADSTGKDADAAPVISGMRNSSSILIFIDVAKAMEGGINFWTSENGVILSEGDDNGLLPLKYFQKVEDRTGGQGVLVKDGVVLKEAPESWKSKGTGRRGGRGGGRGGRGRGG